MPAAYQDQDGKWWKQCSSTKQLFGPVDSLEELGEWFNKHKRRSDGFRNECKLITRKGAPERNKKYYAENTEREKERRKNYRRNNPETIKRYQKSAAGMLTHYKKSAKERGINFTLTLEWFEEQMKLPEFNYCAIFGIKFVDGERNQFSRSLDRVNNSRGYTPDNVKWVCFKYNSWKADLSLEEINMIAEYGNRNANQPLTV